MPVPYYDWISHHAAHRPDKIAAVDLASGRQLTWRDFDQRVARVAGYLREARHHSRRQGRGVGSEHHRHARDPICLF